MRPGIATFLSFYKKGCPVIIEILLIAFGLWLKFLARFIHPEFQISVLFWLKNYEPQVI